MELGFGLFKLFGLGVEKEDEALLFASDYCDAVERGVFLDWLVDCKIVDLE